MYNDEFENKKPDYVYASKDDIRYGEICPYFIRRQKHQKNNFDKICVIIAVSCLFIAFFIVFYNIFLSKTSITTSKKEYYFVTSGQYTSIEILQVQQAYIIERGGAGYVINDGTFTLIVSSYESYDDAYAVCESLLSEDITVDVMKYDINSVAISISEDSETIDYNDEKIDTATLIKQLLAYPFDLYEIMYGVSVSLDSYQITDSYTLSVIQEYKSVIDNMIKPLENYTEFSNIYNYYINLSGSLDDLLTKNSMKELSSSIKYALCDMLVSFNTQFGQ